MAEKLHFLNDSKWTKLLQHMESCRGSGTPSESRKLLNEVFEQSSDWHTFFSSLAKTTVSEVSDGLVLHPMIFTLPNFLQNQILHSIHCSRDKIPRHELAIFIRHLTSCDTSKISHWAKHLLVALKNHVFPKEDHESKQRSSANELGYQFSPLNSIQDLYEATCKRLLKRTDKDVEGELDDSRLNENTKVCNSRKNDRENKASVSTTNAFLQEENLSQDDNNVIIINSDDEVIGWVDNDVSKKTDVTKKAAGSRKRTQDLVDESQTSISPKSLKTMKKDFHEVRDQLSQSQNLSLDKNDDSQFRTMDDGLDKNATANSRHNFGTLENNLKVKLEGFKDCVRSPDSKDLKLSELWQCLSQLTDQQLRQSCQYLGLPDVSDEALVVLFESLRQESVDHQTYAILLDTSLRPKLTKMSSYASHSLERAVTCAVANHSATVVELFGDVLHKLDTNEHQCQLLHSLCHNSLPKEDFSSVIRALSNRDVTMNEHLLQVLQNCVNLRCDLDSACLSDFVDLLSKASPTFRHDAHFGQLVLAFVSKYGSMTSSSDVNKLQMLMGEHTSNFKKPLLRAIKKLCNK